jgi:hypothetical protein
MLNAAAACCAAACRALFASIVALCIAATSFKNARLACSARVSEPTAGCAAVAGPIPDDGADDGADDDDDDECLGIDDPSADDDGGECVGIEPDEDEDDGV